MSDKPARLILHLIEYKHLPKLGSFNCTSSFNETSRNLYANLTCLTKQAESSTVKRVQTGRVSEPSDPSYRSASISIHKFVRIISFVYLNNYNYNYVVAPLSPLQGK